MIVNMNNDQKELKKETQRAVRKLFNFEVDQVDLERPTDPEHGDLATNIAFKLAGRLKKDPKAIAEKIADEMRGDFFKHEARGGFVNFYFTDRFLQNKIESILKFEKKEKEKTMVLDYSAPNIAKPFGIGHLRSTIVGQAIYNIYEYSGWNCIGVNHLGDWGTQYGKLLYQITQKNLDPEELSVKDLERLYVDFHKEAEEHPEMEDEARKWFKKLEDGDEKARKIWKKCVEVSLKEFDKIYSLLEVDIDHVMGESFYEEKMEAVIKEAKEKGVAKESEGALIVDFGEEMPPAMLLKSDGSTTYFTRDLATAKYRIDKWNPDLLIYEIGADQKLHMRQLFRTVEILGWKDKNDFMHVAHGMYRLKDGAMSTRKGRTVHLENVLSEAIERAEKIIENSETTGEITEQKKKEIAKKVGVGAVKYADLKKHYKKDIVFDWDKVLNLKGDSGPYLQYTALRAKSVLKKAESDDFYLIGLSEKERMIVKKASEFEEVVERSEKNFTPSVLAGFAYDLAREFNGFYSEYSILDADTEEERRRRISITETVFSLLEKSLNLLGISIPSEM